MLPHLTHLSHRLQSLPHQVLMGILNVTPNSFSDTGRYFDAPAAVSQGLLMSHAGAAILDLGGEASSFFRPGVTPVPPTEQIRRLIPVIKELTQHTDALLSIDTRSAEVAQAAVSAGAHIINDISAGTHDPAMLPTVAQLGSAIVLMHISPEFPDNAKQDDPDIVATVRAYLLNRAEAAIAAGISPDLIWLDPGLGFGKTPADNLRLALEFPAAEGMPYPIVIGASRKRFLEGLELPEPNRVSVHENAAGHPRDEATARLLAETVRRCAGGRRLVHRVHDVERAARVLGR